MSANSINPIYARWYERDHLIEMLRIHIEAMKKNDLTREEIYASLDWWIKRREFFIKRGCQSMNMHPRLSVICSAPLPVCNRALAALKCFARGQRNFSRVMPHAYLVIRIGRRWRLLSKNGGQQWRLMTHETYNQEYRK